MIELNLLPKEFRKKKKKQIEIPELPYLPIAGGVLALFVVVHIALIVFTGNNRRLADKLSVKWQNMRPQREKTEKIAKEINALQKRVAAVRKIAKPDLDWARLLSGLNEAVIPNIWLAEFNVSTDGRSQGEGDPQALMLSGFAVGRSETAMSTVGRFMESLKSNEDFFRYFDDIELQHIKNTDIAGQEAMMFKFSCAFMEIADNDEKGDEKTIGRR
ncbi:MAG: hypothetical protein GF392_04170 [Candidatus Omnitrophica bacterium]|nr:hypothetical protein [Candidatus Omnitrophota bacterium]